MSDLLSPLCVKNTSLKNRIVMPPMASNTATLEGMATEATFRYYEERADRGVGLIIVEHTYVLKSGKYRERQLGIDCDDHVGPLSELTRHHACSIQLAFRSPRRRHRSSTIGKALGSFGRPASPEHEAHVKSSAASYRIL